MNDARINRLANALLFEAVRVNADWLHVEPDGRKLRIRMRVDGALRIGQPPPIKLAGPLLRWFKDRAGLDLDEERLPQMGTFQIQLKDRARHVRVETVPSLGGEKLVLRFDAPEPWRVRGLDELDMGEKALADFKAVIARRRGLVLFSGPTNSGKNTSCYAALGALDREALSVSSVEVAARSRLPGIHQSLVNEAIGWTQAAALRAMLRTDVDVAYVRELMDLETAHLAVRMALKGGLVLSTLHTYDAPSTFLRLIDMGLEPWLALDSVVLVVAQRLLPRLCPACRAPDSPPRAALLDAGLRPAQLADARICQPAGCPECDDTGWKGQVLVTEHLNMLEPTTSWSISQPVLDRAPPHTVRSSAIAAGMRTLREAALARVLQGETTLSEALIATPSMR